MREKLNIKWSLFNKSYWCFRRCDTSDLLYPLTWTNLFGDYMVFKYWTRMAEKGKLIKVKPVIVSFHHLQSFQLETCSIQKPRIIKSRENGGFVFVFLKDKMNSKPNTMYKRAIENTLRTLWVSVWHCPLCAWRENTQYEKNNLF